MKTPLISRILLLTFLILSIAAFRRVIALPSISRWSTVATWRNVGQSLPCRGADVTIPAGQTILLDTSPPPLAHLIINGTLAVPDTADAHLEVGQVVVNGTFRIGSKNAPFRHQFTLTLTGNAQGENHPTMAARSLSVQKGGRIEWHGTEPGVSWLHLAATAPVGAKSITIENDVTGWKMGDRIVLASTDFDAHQAEERAITAIHGNEITLKEPLRYTHWGRIEDGVDERGEVALLTRRIVVQGSKKGGCVMIMAGSVAQLTAVEFRQLGERGQKGRYPVHFHQAGDASLSFVRGCSIHHCYNRSLTIHGTSHLRVSDNVSFDTIGHAYFLEDGDETKNQLVHNLGLLTRAALPGEAILPSDRTPATFWITNPDNALVGNVAAGSDFHGFWYSIPKHPTGLAENDENNRTSWPRHTPLGLFTQNIAHSNAHDGLFVDNGPNAPGETETPNYQPRVNSAPTVRGSTKISPADVAVFHKLTAYKNRRRGAWLRGDHLRLVGACLADNSIGATFAASESFLQDSVIVGETANLGTAEPGETTGRSGRTLPKPQEPETPLCGFEFYDGLVGVQGTNFIHFRPDDLRPAGAIGYLRYSPFYVNPRNFAERVRFVDANAVYLARKGEPGNPLLSGDGYRSAVFRDRDGSLTGKAGDIVTVKNPLLQNKQCEFNADWNAAVCTNRYGHLFVDNRDKIPQPIGSVTFARESATSSALPYRVFGAPTAAGKPATSFQTNLIVGDTYRVVFGKRTPDTYRLTLRDCEPGDWIMVRVESRKTGKAIVVREGTQTLPEVSRRDVLDRASRSMVFRDLSQNRVYIKLVTDAVSARTGAAVLVTYSDVKGKKDRL